MRAYRKSQFEAAGGPFGICGEGGENEQ